MTALLPQPTPTEPGLIRVEFDVLEDTINELLSIHAALAYRHGPRFRDLEKRMEIWAQKNGADGCSIQQLPEMVLIAVPSPEMVGFIKDARRLGITPRSLT